MKKISRPALAELTVGAVFTALICVISQLSILTPVGVPVTLQTLIVALCGYLLGAKRAVFSVAAYILIGAIGLPVFSGFRGGLQQLFGITGGFIFGFLLLCLACGISRRLTAKAVKILFGVAGTLLCHIMGTVWLALLSGSNIAAAFVTGSLPFLPKDIICTVLAFFLACHTEKMINSRKT
ncbi:MAG: biotin transporter BioY [Clostridia bacterium]|nr:biotin transporter BioY [Clostridia bacterium]